MHGFNLPSLTWQSRDAPALQKYSGARCQVPALGSFQSPSGDPPLGLGLRAHSVWNPGCWLISLGDLEPLQGRRGTDSLMTLLSLYPPNAVPSAGCPDLGLPMPALAARERTEGRGAAGRRDSLGRGHRLGMGRSLTRP